MSVRKEDQEKKESIFESFRTFLRREEETLPQEEDTSFLGMARQLRSQKETEAKENDALQRDITDWFAGEAMKMLHMTGTALGDRIQNMIMGDSASDNEGGE